MNVIGTDTLSQAITCTGGQLTASTNSSDSGLLQEFVVRATGDPHQEPVQLEWSWPLGDGVTLWSPDRSAQLPADWSSSRSISSMRSAPVTSVVAADDRSVCTLSLSTAVRRAQWAVGIREETAEVTFRITVEDIAPSTGSGDREFRLRIDLRSQHFATALAEVAAGWSSELSGGAAAVPDLAHRAAYSTWYSNHQHISATDVEALAGSAADAGLKTIIVDDGWHTVDRQRGYAFCGDWEPSPTTFADMADHVERVHQTGIAYLLWFAPPLIGHRSAAWEQLKDMTMGEAAGLGCHVLDPRFAAVRDHLVECCVRAVRDWGMDGLKIDFVDMWASYDAPVTSEMDCASVPEAVERLLGAIRDGVLAVRDDLLIEFRQGYVSPRLWPYATILRAGDCPMDLIENRVRTIDLRLLAGGRAVHADMIMWHPDATDEQVAAQLIASLFATPQISMDPARLSPAQAKVLSFWLDFMARHRATLLHGQLLPSRYDARYPQVRASHRDPGSGRETMIIACYADATVRFDSDLPSELIMVNAGAQEELVLSSPGAEERVITIQSSAGDVVSRHVGTVPTGLWSVTVPVGGLVTVA